MNVQPKLSHDDPMALHPQATTMIESAQSRRQPGGPRAFNTWLATGETWPIEFEVEPWRP
ncbi:MAG: hypothetical protein ACYC2H_13715 [Thermoplasmatota archaeon]